MSMKSNIDQNAVPGKICAWAQVCSLKAGSGKLVLFEPNSLAELLECRQATAGKLLILGNGSNLVGSDAIEPMQVLRLGRKGCFGSISNVSENRFRVGCAGNLSQILRRLAMQGYGGLSGLSGIPGTLGGALAMNAGANGQEIGAYVLEIEGLDLRSGQAWHWRRGQGGWAYRRSPVPGTVVALQALLELQKVDVDQENMLLTAERRRRQKVTPAGASAGSVFRNPATEQAAGYLLEMAGCKELSSGAYSVSQQHANWIVNLSRQPGKAQECRKLVQIMQEKVQEKFNITLQCEWRWAEE